MFDTAGNWELICACVREALDAGAAPDAVRAVSATSMREGMVLYDARGHELWACTNADGRAGREAADLVESGAAREIYELAGDWVSITAPPRFRWLARHEPDVFAAIARVGMLGDWILTRLSGEFVTDRSLGSSSGMFDLAAGDWSDRVLEICGLDRSVFPRVVASGDVVGAVTPRRRPRPACGRARRSSRPAPTRRSRCSASASRSPAASRSSAAASGSTRSSSTSR